jgi:hypothetical protein
MRPKQRARAVAAVHVPRRKKQPLKDAINVALGKAYAAQGLRRTGRLVATDSFSRKEG